MAVGKLKEVVRFEVNYAEVLGAGYDDVYYELLTTRGYLKKLHGKRSNETGEIVNTGSYELYVRYQAYIEANLNVGVKIVINGKDYKIETWERTEEKNFYYKFIINEKRG